MATVPIAHHPELTAEAAMKAFGGHFAGKYQVYKSGSASKGFLANWVGIASSGNGFVVKKSNWTGVRVEIKQRAEHTDFELTFLMPNVTFQLLFGHPLVQLFLRRNWKPLEAEVQVFIENAAQFR